MSLSSGGKLKNNMKGFRDTFFRNKANIEQELMNKKVQEFLVEYRLLAGKYGLDFAAQLQVIQLPPQPAPLVQSLPIVPTKLV